MQKANIQRAVQAKTSQRADKKVRSYKHLPVKITEKQFNCFFLPHLSLPKQSRHPKIPLWRVFNYILYQLHTGCQWEQLPILLDPKTGKNEIHHISVWKWFDRWSGDGSFEKVFVNSVQELQNKKKLRLGKLHGDGTNTVAKKGVVLLVIPATSTRKAAR